VEYPAISPLLRNTKTDLVRSAARLAMHEETVSNAPPHSPIPDYIFNSNNSVSRTPVI
jgi:hypothetical protein